MVILKAEKNCAEKHVRDVEKREESLLKERDDLLERCTEERAQTSEQRVTGWSNISGKRINSIVTYPDVIREATVVDKNSIRRISILSVGGAAIVLLIPLLWGAMGNTVPVVLKLLPSTVTVTNNNIFRQIRLLSIAARTVIICVTPVLWGALTKVGPVAVKHLVSFFSSP